MPIFCRQGTGCVLGRYGLHGMRYPRRHHGLTVPRSRVSSELMTEYQRLGAGYGTEFGPSAEYGQSEEGTTSRRIQPHRATKFQSQAEAACFG